MNSRRWLATCGSNPLGSYSALPFFSSLNCGVVCLWRQAARGMGGVGPLSQALCGAAQRHHGVLLESKCWVKKRCTLTFKIREDRKIDMPASLCLSSPLHLEQSCAPSRSAEKVGWWLQPWGWWLSKLGMLFRSEGTPVLGGLQLAPVFRCRDIIH